MKFSERTKLHRLPNRGSHEPETIHAVLDAACVAHIGFQADRFPVVIPTLYGRDGDKLYLHGSVASRMLKVLESGAPACVTVTLLDGLVLARSAFHHSINYRSVVAFGTARKIEDRDQKLRALRIISEHMLKGRWDEVRAPNAKELNATAVLEFAIEEASAKIRTGPPTDDAEDYALPVWAGVLPLRMEAQEPVADARLTEHIAVPPYLSRYRP